MGSWVDTDDQDTENPLASVAGVAPSATCCAPCDQLHIGGMAVRTAVQTVLAVGTPQVLVDHAPHMVAYGEGCAASWRSIPWCGQSGTRHQRLDGCGKACDGLVGRP